MTSITAPHAAVRTAPRAPLSRSLAAAGAAVARSFRGFATTAELERQRPLDDPYVLMALLRG